MTRTFHFAESQLFTCLEGRPEELLADRASRPTDSGRDVEERDDTLAFVAHAANCHAVLLAALRALLRECHQHIPDTVSCNRLRVAVAAADIAIAKAVQS